MNNPQQQQFKVDITQTTAEICEKCENNTFIQVYQLRKLSALLSPTGEETKIPIQMFACSKCNHVNMMYLFLLLKCVNYQHYCLLMEKKL